MKNEFHRWLAARLEELRKSKHWTLKMVAKLIGLKLSTYSAYEEGRAQPSPSTLKKLWQLYRITPNQFYKGCPEIPTFQNN